MKLTKAHLTFLAALIQHGPTHRKGLPVSSEQRKVRQDCIKWKLASYTRDGWEIRPAGRRAATDGETKP